MFTSFKELYRFRDLLWTLALRDIKVRYRQTILGVAWAVLQPLAFMLIFTLIFARFGNVSSDGAPYPLFSYAGLAPWLFFSTGLTLSVNSIAANMRLVQKIYFPREVLPMGVIIGCTLDFLIACSLLAGLMAFYRVPPSLHLLWLPWLIGLEVALLVGVSLFMAALNVFYRDIKYIVPLAVQLWMFVTPVIYSTSMVPAHLRRWYMLNPMAVVIDGFRRVIIHGQPPDAVRLALTTVVVAAFSILAYVYFKRAELRFADVI